MTGQTTTQPAAAAPTNQPQQPGLLGSLAPIALMLLVFYFLIMRPQQKRESKRRELIAGAKKGDKVLISGGIIGTLHKIVNEKELSLEIAENVRIRVLKDAVTNVLEKCTDLGKEEEEEDTKTSITPNVNRQQKRRPKKTDQ
jgi:preprotein translocase subunit YajC